LGYYKIRGLCQAIRNVLEYSQIPFEDKYYSSYDEWLSVKHKMGLPFPNLPYFFDGDFKLTESNAILQYVGKKNNLCGSTDEECAILNMVLGRLYDWRGSVASTAYNPNFASLKEKFLSTTYANYSKEFNEYLAGKKWLLNEKLSIADFVLYEICDQGHAMGAVIPANLVAFVTKFEALPTLAAYFKSERYFKRPFNNTSASFR